MGLLLIASLSLGGVVLVVAASPHCRGRGCHMGLRIPGTKLVDAVHLVVVRADAGRIVRLGASSAVASAQELADLPTAGRVSQRRARRGARPRPCCRHSASTAWLFSWFRVLQQGNIQIYLLYIFLALIVLLLWR